MTVVLVSEELRFGNPLKSGKKILKEGNQYELKGYNIEEANKKHWRTDFQIKLVKTTTWKRIEKERITTAKKFRVAELKNSCYEKMLVMTSTVEIKKVGEQLRPSKKYIRKVLVGDESSDMTLIFGSYRPFAFRYNVGDRIELQNVKVLYGKVGKEICLKRSDNTTIIKLQ